MNHTEVLQLFNEKVEALARTEVARISPQAKMTFQRGQGWSYSYSGPNDVHVDAAVLSIRFFIQDNEPTSVRNMARRYEIMPVSQQLRNRFTAAREHLNSLLDRETNWSVEEGRPLTRRDLLDWFLYGALAHSNEGKRKSFVEVRGTPFYPGLMAEFIFVLQGFLSVAEEIKAINEEALMQLDRPTEAHP